MAKPVEWRNRIVGYDVVEADQLLANPANWRIHPKAQQDALTGVTTITRKWGRWQHQVDYRPFKSNHLMLKEGVIIPTEPNNYGMKLTKLAE